jgi:YrbI family 3-deoxy-D-manno-octulosonate 8-phosphate phosphatase
MPELDAMPHYSKVHTVAFDFDGVFTDNKVYVDQEGRELVRCDRADGLGMDFVRTYQKTSNLKTHFFVLSKEKNPVVMARAHKLKLNCEHGISDKLEFMRDYFSRTMPDDSDPFKGFIYLGNDLNDLPLLGLARYSVVPSDAHPLVKKHASLTLPQNGGDGFVRAFIEKFLGIENLPHGELLELISNC